MRYWPVPSVTTARTFSISAGLAASTVTPGRTAPDASLTVPAMDAWAYAAAGANTTNASAIARFLTRRMWPPGIQSGFDRPLYPRKGEGGEGEGGRAVQ